MKLLREIMREIKYPQKESCKNIKETFLVWYIYCFVLYIYTYLITQLTEKIKKGFFEGF